jgi:hypothetical protein
MIRIAFVLTPLFTAFVCLLAAAPAQAAGAARTFVSAAGSDSNNCINVATPCRHLATAYAATAPNGEIYVLDPANYGALTITGPVSIEGHGWASIAPIAGQAAITITASASDKINIIGVVLDGTALANTTGIHFTGGGSLNVQDSVIRNFGEDGIHFAPVVASQLSVSSTVLSDNAFYGIYFDGSAAVTGVLDHITLENNSNGGLFVGGHSADNVNVTVGNSVSASNPHGIFSDGSVATANTMVRNTTIAGNTIDGVDATGAGATVRVTRSTITGNGAGWASSSGGVVLSYGDNNIDGNTNANTEPPNPLPYK